MIARALMMLVGVTLASMGAGMTMLGIFAFVGMPMLIVGLMLIIEAADTRS